MKRFKSHLLWPDHLMMPQEARDVSEVFIGTQKECSNIGQAVNPWDRKLQNLKLL